MKNKFIHFLFKKLVIKVINIHSILDFVDHIIMAKSDVRKLMMKEVEESVGKQAFESDVMFFDTLTENAKRNHVSFVARKDGRPKDAMIMSLVDCSVKLVHFLSSFCKTWRTPISVEDFEAEMMKMDNEDVGVNEKDDDRWEADPFPKDFADQGVHRRYPSGKLNRTGERRYEGQSPFDKSNTWQFLVYAFIAQLANEFVRLSPPVFMDHTVPRLYAEKGPRPCLAPVVVLGFDKSSESIKLDTQLDREAQKKRSIESMEKADIEHGYVTCHGIPVNWDHISSSQFDARTEKLPYPALKLMSGNNKRMVIRYICRQIIRHARDGYLAERIMNDCAKQRKHRIMHVVLDGHCLYPEDDVDLAEGYANGDFGDPYLPFKKRCHFNKENIDDLPHGVSSPLCDTPVSIFILSDPDRRCISKVDSIYDCPECEVIHSIMWNLAMGKTHDDDEKKVVDASIEIDGTRFCTPECKRLSLLKRGIDVNGVPTYCFVGTKLPEEIRRFFKREYPDAPSEMMQFKSNEIGEFDFTTFHYIYNLIHKRAKQTIEHDFTYPERKLADPSLSSVSVRIVTVDTDAFIISLLAVELLPRILEMDVNIFLVNNHSAGARKANASRKATDPDGIRDEDVYERLLQEDAAPKFPVYVMRSISSTFAKLYPRCHYPASCVAMWLFFKKNDYLPTGLKRGALHTMYKAYQAVVLPDPTSNLIIDPTRHPTAWNANRGSALPNATVLFDHRVLAHLVRATDGIKKIERQTSEQREKRQQQMLYILALYVDSITGRGDVNRTIPASEAYKYGF